ncbi:MAG: hydrolase [Treponema sp.]|jgi:predicted hydrolase (HD superfamily)|nr:hydrolase [Treponema sp.]
MNRSEAWELLKKYNKDKFHLQHALTVEGVMRWFAENSDGEKYDAEFWGVAGLLHDIDFEQYPNEHCLKAPQLLREAGANEALIHAVVSHGYGITVDVEPTHFMEKVLFATDELTGLIWAVAIIRPTKSVQDLEVKSVRKKYKTPAFAAGCSREVIQRGAVMLGWDLDILIERTILAMRSCEASVLADTLRVV